MAEDAEVMLKDVRLSFADNLFEPEMGDKRTKGKHKGKIPFRWSVNFLIPKSNTVLIDAVKKALIEARDAKWPENPPKIKGDKLCLQDGDEVDYAGYADHFYVSASRTMYGTEDADGKVKAPKRPFKIIGSRKVKNEDGELKFPELSEGDAYSGCYVNAILRIWAQDDEDYGKRLNGSIEAVQFARHGEAFGGGKKVNVDEAFEDMGTEDDDGFDTKKKPAAKSEDDEDDGGLI